MTKTSLEGINIQIDSEKNSIVVNGSERISLFSPEGFKILSHLWLKVGWDQKHMYTFTWMGRPVIQIPDDMIRMQEVIYTIKPDVILETGVAHGGSLIFYATLCKAMNTGRVIGIDLEIRSHNRAAIESHELSNLITLVEGSSIQKETLLEVRRHVHKNETGLVILDSCHDFEHVLEELRLYKSFVSLGSYLVVTDGSQKWMHDVPRAKIDYPQSESWTENNPSRAIEAFVKNDDDFEIVEPSFLFNEGRIDFRITHWPSAFLKRVR
jgi:cephalosporin hydroxylase